MDYLKLFFKLNGLNWTGFVCGYKDDDFRPATEEDFDKLKELDYLIAFGKDGQIALNAEIDLITFKINGESFDYAVSCYAGDNNQNKKVCKERDLSKEWIKFQLQNKGMVYATALRRICKDLKDEVKDETERRIRKIKLKIEHLNNSIEKTEESYNQKIKEINKLEKMADNIELV